MGKNFKKYKVIKQNLFVFLKKNISKYDYIIMDHLII